MVNNTTTSAVKSKHRNDGQGLSDAQTFHRLLISTGEKKRSNESLLTIYKQKQRTEGKRSSDSD